MTTQHYIGIDPGPTPGFVMLTLRGRHIDVDVLQCTSEIAPLLLWALLDQHRADLGTAPMTVALERFVVGRRSSRSSSARAGETTRELVGRLQETAQREQDVAVVLRTASQVKHWATDVRLKAVQFKGHTLLDATTGMRHARDAARHALFAAVHDGGLPDPLSKEWGRG